MFRYKLLMKKYGYIAFIIIVLIITALIWASNISYIIAK